MRRYRKGQTFRPPTAAESAAHADATESHRRAPAQPQDRTPVGQSILVKTPEGGIPARDDDTIYWEKCKRCIQRYAGEEKEIVETDEEVIVYNLFTGSVAGDEYAATALTECGTRYVLQVASTRYFELKDPHTPGSTTTAHPQDWDSDTSDWVTDTDLDREFDVTDPLSEYRGRGKDDFSSPHDTGSEGVAEKNSESGEWEIVRMQKHALWLVGSVYADFETTDSTFEISPNPQVCFPIGSIITDTDPAANITVYNIHDWDGTAGDTAEVRWNESNDHWECTELDC